MRPQVRVFADPEETVRALAAEVARSARRAVARAGRFSLVLSGGTTPGPLFRLLAQEYRWAIPWRRTDLFWSDERAVPVTDPRSNFGEVEKALLRPLGRQRPNVHRIEGELRPLQRSAERYAERLGEYFAPRRRGGLPERTFDLALLGVGPDGHTASVFPAAPPDARAGRWVEVRRRSPTEPHVPRLSLSLAALGRSAEMAFLVCGPEKREVLRRILGRPPGPRRAWPAARLGAGGHLTWYLDHAADPSRPAPPIRRPV